MIQQAIRIIDNAHIQWLTNFLYILNLSYKLAFIHSNLFNNGLLILRNNTVYSRKAASFIPTITFNYKKT